MPALFIDPPSVSQTIIPVIFRYSVDPPFRHPIGCGGMADGNGTVQVDGRLCSRSSSDETLVIGWCELPLRVRWSLWRCPPISQQLCPLSAIPTLLRST